MQKNDGSLRLRGGGHRKSTPAQKRQFVQDFHRAAPSMSVDEIRESYSDEFDDEISKSFVYLWWNKDTTERKAGSGGHNKIGEATKRKVVKLMGGFTELSGGGGGGGVKRKLSSRVWVGGFK